MASSNEIIKVLDELLDRLEREKKALKKIDEEKIIKEILEKEREAEISNPARKKNIELDLDE